MRMLARIAVAATAGIVALAVPLAASAHEQRKVGQWNFTVGWGEEPLYAGFKNSVQFILKDAGGNPVTDLKDTLKVSVISGTQSEDLALTATFDPDTKLGTPGDYRAWFIPTRTGNYTFHFTGTIHGQKIDEKFTSSDTTFDAVKDPSEAQFPVKAPSTNQVLDRLQRDESRSNSDLSTARLLAIIGIAVGVVALIAGVGVGLSRRSG